jgi:hypothetical protein
VGGLEEERTGPAGQDDELAINAPPDAAGTEQAARLVGGDHRTRRNIAG